MIKVVTGREKCASLVLTAATVSSVEVSISSDGQPELAG
jgi:hypothetical protein